MDTQGMLEYALDVERLDAHGSVARAAKGAEVVLEGDSLADAARMLEGKPVGVIVSEARAGALDAASLVRLAKARHPETVSVVLSDRSDAGAAAALIRQGLAYRMLPKPLTPGFIRIVLDAALRRHRELLEPPCPTASCAA